MSNKYDGLVNAALNAFAGGIKPLRGSWFEKLAHKWPAACATSAACYDEGNDLGSMPENLDQYTVDWCRVRFDLTELEVRCFIAGWDGMELPARDHTITDEVEDSCQEGWLTGKNLAARYFNTPVPQ